MAAGQTVATGASAAAPAVQTVRVLAVEDSNTQADLLLQYLRDERLALQAGCAFAPTRVADLAGALAQLSRDERFDVVLLDLTLPDSSGIDTLDAVTAATELPVVVLSASGPEVGFEAMAHGAQDFVIKDAASLQSLPRTLRYAMVRAGLSRELAAALEARELADQQFQTFMSMASHELRSPIAALSGLSQLLSAHWDQLDEGKRRELAGRVHRRLGHAQAVATLYLNAAAGQQEIHAARTEVDVAELCADVAGSVPTEPALVDVSPGTALVDPSHLAAVVANLLTNAAKYGGAPVHLTGDQTSITISDAGRGVPDEDVDGLFEPWQRRPRAGLDSTGIGLALSAQLARANGCTLVYDRVDDRTCFTVLLPSTPGPATTSQPD